MAYNLQSLITILEQILNPEQMRWTVDHNKPQLQSLLEKAASLQQILEKSPLTKIESLESQIRDAAHEAEDIIESHMVDQMLSNDEGVSLTFSTPDLQQVMQQLDSAIGTTGEARGGEDAWSDSSSTGASFSRSIDLVKSKAVVGIDGDLMQLKERLTGDKRKLEIVPIVGMGGIGKTTLARKLYQDQSIVEHFTVLAWTNVSQDYNMKAILLSLLRNKTGNGSNHDVSDLRDELYRSLYGRRYMIVLDDVWSIKFWDEIRMYFPDNNKGSRIVITTRESDVAKHVNSQGVQHQVKLLSETTSWDLLRQIVFGEEKCPDFLQGIGEKIASDCGGLPLAINVIGGLLSKVERSRDGWENIANNVASAIVELDKGFSNILSLSYNHLPNHLKPCFLYMAAFPEDYEIESSKLVHLWVAEGFLKSNGDKSMEEEAKDYLKALVERNLLLVKEEERWKGKATIFSIHDLLRDLCMRKAYEDKFLYVKNSPSITFFLVDEEEKSKRLSICDLWKECLYMMREVVPQFSNSRRVSVSAYFYPQYQMEDEYASAELMSLSLTRSFLVLTRENKMMLSSFIHKLRLVRVLDVIDLESEEFPIEILQLVNLRFLAVSCSHSGIPSGISRLWNLQTLIASTDRSAMPFEIWELSELRHLDLVNHIIRFEDEYVKRFFHKKVQAISLVEITRSLTRSGFFESIPNIKDLAIYYDVRNLQSNVVDLSHLHKLETLRCESSFVTYSHGFWSSLKFPFALRELTLDRIAIFPRASTLLCALPDLEVLKIESCIFGRKDEELEAVAYYEDEEWEVAEGDEFRSLRFLSLAYLTLKRWRADETNFPRLGRLLLIDCDELEEIPIGIGEIPTLQLVELERCSDSSVASAKQIVEEQQSEYGNYDLKLRLV